MNTMKLFSISMLTCMCMHMCACASSGHDSSPLPTAYEVHISPQWALSGDSTPIDVITGSLNDWTTAVGVKFDIKISDDACEGACFQIVPQSSMMVEGDCGSDLVVGCTYNNGGHLVAIDDGFVYTFGSGWKDILRFINTHEFGHIAGLAHVNNVRAIMYPSLDGDGVIGPLDVQQYWSLRQNP